MQWLSRGPNPAEKSADSGSGGPKVKRAKWQDDEAEALSETPRFRATDETLHRFIFVLFLIRRLCDLWPPEVIQEIFSYLRVSDVVNIGVPIWKVYKDAFDKYEKSEPGVERDWIF